MSSLYDYVTERLTPRGAQSTPLTPVSTVHRVTEDEYLRRLGVAIQRCRKFRKLSQEELGKLVGVPPNTISRWENGVSSLSAFNLATIREKLEVPAEWLLVPTDSISEIERRLADLRRDAVEAARLDVADEQARPAGAGRGVRRGKR